jgi:hypothetical protein
MAVIINGNNTPTAGAVAVGDGTTLAFTAAGTSGQILKSNGAGVPTWINNDAGTVTAVSVASSNGFTGTSSGGATPALTLQTSITGVLKGNGTAISAATAGTDYLAPPSGTALLKANSGGALANATAGTDYVTPTGTETLSGKTLTNPTVTSYIETVYALSGTAIDPANGTIQTKTLGANTTFTESLADGQSVVLMLNPVTYTVTWPTMTWISIAGSGTAPTLEASSTNVVTIWQVGGTVYGNWAGSA